MVDVKISCGSLNVRGLKDTVKRKALFLFCKGQKSNILFLQETHSSEADAKFWTTQWGDRILFSHGSNRSAGVAICFNRFPGEIVTYRADENGHWLTVVVKTENLFLISTNIYGYNNDGQNKVLLETITKIIFDFKSLYQTAHILVGGDWNMVPDEWVDRMPPRIAKPQFNDIIGSFMTDNNLTDIWRSLNPELKSFSWFKSNGENKSRIDYWLISYDLIRFCTQTNLSRAPLTDHCFIDLYLEPKQKEFSGKKCWKFNAKLLENNNYCKMIRDIIKGVEKNVSFGSYITKWEFIKFKIREFSIQFSKDINKQKREYESNLLREINLCCNKVNVDDLDRNKLQELQGKLDELYLERAYGAFIRSRAKWTEEGEKNSAYFCSLEKCRQQRNLIDCLIIQGEECKDFKEIEKEVFLFYSKLYSSNYSVSESNFFFNKIKDNIPLIDDSFKKWCEADLEIEELDAVVMKMTLNKSPGSDGLTSNFYQFFWKEVRDLIFNALVECISQKELMVTMKQGLITLIPKPGKDKRILDNLRPITLLNTDYKLLSGVIAARLKKGISSIISETQSGFLKGRSIHNNIRLVLDLIDYSDLLQENGFLIFLDFYKAFDSVEHPFILKTLECFGFGSGFIGLIEMLYNNINSSVALGGGTCKRFEIRRGIRQGCSSSPLLFIMVAEMLSILIKNNHFEGLKILDRQIIISQLADDTTLFLKNEDQIPLALEAIKTFSKASGLQLNLEKCEILTLHDSLQPTICDVKVKKEVKYLGIVISKDKTISDSKNVINNIGKCKLILNKWLQRDITIFGRVLLSKMDSLSRLIYPASSLPISTKLIKMINSINFKFIWRNKCQYIRKADITKNYAEGGISAIDFDVMNGVLKLKWLKSYINNKNSFWFIVPNMVFQKLGGIDFLLRCDFECKSLPVKLSKFHQQVLLYWKLIYSHNFTPHNSPIWNNRYILCNRKSLYIEEWKDNGIWAIAHFMDEEGKVLKHEDFCEKFHIKCTVKCYNRVVNAIPTALRLMIKESIVYTKISPNLRQLCIDGVEFCDYKCSNKVIRSFLINIYSPNQVKRQYILKDFELDKIIKIRRNYLSFPLAPKVKEINFKILNEIYPTKEFLRAKFGFDAEKCGICGDASESLEHLFFYCTIVHLLWEDLQSWLLSKNLSLSVLNIQVIKFGTFNENKKEEFVLNNIILLVKFFIHKCKYLKVKPTLSHWMNEFKLFCKSLKLMKSPKALKLWSLLVQFHLI